MDRNDNISKLFQQSQHRLEERPSSRAWQRLEQKLDAKKARHRRIIYRYISTVAAVIAVLAMITAVSIFDFPKNETVAENATETDNSTIALNNNAEKIAEFKKKEGIDKSIEELRAAQDVEMEVSEEEGTDIYVDDELPVSENKQIAQREPTPKRMPKVEKPEVIIEPSTKDETPNAADVVAKKMEMNEDFAAEEVETSAPPPMIQATRTRSDVSEAEQKHYKEAMKKRKKEMEKRISSKMKKARTSKPKTSAPTAKNVITDAAMQNTMEPVKIDLKSISIKDFEWLVGEWSDTEKTSNEKWKKKGKSLVGEGYVVTGYGQKTFSENMKIRKKSGKLYFYTPLIKGGEQVRFELVEYDGQMAVFENKTITFPQQILVQKKGQNMFVITYQNAGNMNESQQDYLRNRNYISREKATRKLKRSMH